MYSPEQISWIKAQCSLTELVSQLSGQSFRGSGKNLAVKCFLPGHNDKTPSFVVNTHKDTWRCYGACGDGGDVISLVMTYYQMDFISAIEQLSTTFNFELPDQEGFEVDEDAAYRYSVYAAGNAYIDFCRQEKYLKGIEKYIVGRGFDPRIAELYRIGFHPRGERVPDDIDLSLIGLRSDKMPANKSILEGRIIIPYLNSYRKPYAFTGRKHSKDTSDSPPYVNSKTTPMFRKDHVLYNAYQVRNGLSKASVKMPYVMEGQHDAQTIPNLAYGKGGSALSKMQARAMVKDGATSFCLVYDGDNAGIKSVIKDSKMILDMGYPVYSVVLPDGMDPNKILQEHGDVRKYVDDNMEDVVTFAYKTSRQPATALKIDEALDILSHTHDPFIQQDQIKSLSKITGTSRRALTKRLETIYP